MKILTLNMNMFKFQIDNSFSKFMKKHKPDIAIIQECRYTVIKNYKDYIAIKPNQFDDNEEIDGRYVITMGLCEEDIWERIKVEGLKKYGRCYVQIKIKNIEKRDDWSIVGVHIPADNGKNENDIRELIEVIKKSKSDIICGDLNASCKKTTSLNWRMLKEITSTKNKTQYVNFWEKGLKEDKAFYIDYNGEKIKADKDKFYRTFAGNTHIDYVIGKDLNLKEIVIDMRTLAFTDHCAVIVECEKHIK